MFSYEKKETLDKKGFTNVSSPEGGFKIWEITYPSNYEYCKGIHEDEVKEVDSVKEQ